MTKAPWPPKIGGPVLFVYITELQGQGYGGSTLNIHFAIDITATKYSNIYLRIFLQYLSFQNMKGGRNASRNMTIDLGKRCTCRYLRLLEG